MKDGKMPIEPGEFTTEDAITLENGADEMQFDNGVSPAFLAFDDSIPPNPDEKDKKD